MSRIRNVKTTFTAGEVSSSLLGRGDLRAYDNGALSLTNVFIQPTGGVTRRAGLRFPDSHSRFRPALAVCRTSPDRPFRSTR